MSNSIIFHRFSTFGWGDKNTHENVFRCSYLESKTEPSVAKAQDYMGGTPHRKNLYWEWGGGDTAHTLLKRGTIGVGTPHNIERKSKSLN